MIVSFHPTQLPLQEPITLLIAPSITIRRAPLKDGRDCRTPCAMRSADVNRANVLVVAIATVLIGGCVPGQYMSSSGSPGGSVVEGDHVEMVQITPELVTAERSARAPSKVPAELQGYRPDSYRISPGDTLLVTVWDHPELTTPAGTQQAAVTNGRLVYPDGTMFFPFAGQVKVAGMTIEEVRNTLSSKLARYIQQPQVDVNVVGSGGRVSVQGAFENTGPQDITTTPLTLSQAIGTATVNVEQADLSGFVLTRDGKSYPLDLDALNRNGAVAPDLYLKPGDHLYMPYNDRKEAYVLGEVLRPQAITFKTTDMSLTQALGRAGGLNPVSAKGEAVYVIRGIEEMQQTPARVYHLNAKSPAAFALADRFSIRPGDVVFVGPAGVTRWNRFLSQLLPLSGIISNAASAQYNLDRN